MWAKFWIDKEKVDQVIATLNEYLAVQIERTEILRKTKGLSEEELDLFRVEAKKTDRLGKLVEDFQWSINSGDTEQTENEQIEAITKWIGEKLVKEVGYSYGGKTLVDSLKHYYQKVLDQKEKAYEVYATLTDDQRVKLLAVQFLLEQATYASTHRAKNARIQQITETITTIVENLGRIDKNSPEQYFWRIRSNVGNWDYVQALRDMHYQKVELDNLRKENGELKQKVEALETETVSKGAEDFAEDEIPFD